MQYYLRTTATFIVAVMLVSCDGGNGTLTTLPPGYLADSMASRQSTDDGAEWLADDGETYGFGEQSQNSFRGPESDAGQLLDLMVAAALNRDYDKAYADIKRYCDYYGQRTSNDDAVRFMRAIHEKSELYEKENPQTVNRVKSFFKSDEYRRCNELMKELEEKVKLGSSEIQSDLMLESIAEAWSYIDDDLKNPISYMNDPVMQQWHEVMGKPMDYQAACYGVANGRVNMVSTSLTFLDKAIGQGYAANADYETKRQMDAIKRSMEYASSQYVLARELYLTDSYDDYLQRGDEALEEARLSLQMLVRALTPKDTGF